MTYAELCRIKTAIIDNSYFRKKCGVELEIIEAAMVVLKTIETTGPNGENDER